MAADSADRSVPVHLDRPRVAIAVRIHSCHSTNRPSVQSEFSSPPSIVEVCGVVHTTHLAVMTIMECEHATLVISMLGTTVTRYALHTVPTERSLVQTRARTFVAHTVNGTWVHHVSPLLCS